MGKRSTPARKPKGAAVVNCFNVAYQKVIGVFPDPDAAFPSSMANALDIFGKVQDCLKPDYDFHVPDVEKFARGCFGKANAAVIDDITSNTNAVRRPTSAAKAAVRRPKGRGGKAPARARVR